MRCNSFDKPQLQTILLEIVNRIERWESLKFSLSFINIRRIPERWECVYRRVCTYRRRRESIRVYMHTHAEYTCIHAHIHMHMYIHICVQIRENECASNFARDRQALAEYRLAFWELAISGAAEVQVVAADEESISKYVMRVKTRLRRLASRFGLRCVKEPITNPGNLGFPLEGLSLTSAYTSPSLSLFRPRTAHQHVAGFLAWARRATGILVAARATKNLASLASWGREKERNRNLRTLCLVSARNRSKGMRTRLFRVLDGFRYYKTERAEPS